VNEVEIGLETASVLDFKDNNGYTWFQARVENNMGNAHVDVVLVAYDSIQGGTTNTFDSSWLSLQLTRAYMNNNSPIVPNYVFKLNTVNGLATYRDPFYSAGALDDLNGSGTSMFATAGGAQVQTYGGTYDTTAPPSKNMLSALFTFAPCRDAVNSTDTWFCLKNLQYGFMDVDESAEGYFAYSDGRLTPTLNRVFGNTTAYSADGVAADAATAPRWFIARASAYNWALPINDAQICLLFRRGPNGPVRIVESGSLAFAEPNLNISSSCTGIMREWRGGVTLKREWLPYGSLIAHAEASQGLVDSCTDVTTGATVAYDSYDIGRLGPRNVQLTPYYKTTFYLLASSEYPVPLKTCASLQVPAVLSGFSVQTCLPGTNARNAANFPIGQAPTATSCFLTDVLGGSLYCSNAGTSSLAEIDPKLGISSKDCPSTSKALPPWAIALICLACVVLIVAVLFLILFCKRPKTRK